MSKKVLIVLTSHATHASGKPTGYWLSELTHAYEVFKNADLEVDMISPKGGESPMDPSSRETSDAINAKYLSDGTFMEYISHTKRPEEVDPKNYDVIYYPGGHGPMWDLSKDKTIAAIARAIYEGGGVVSAVCHGPAALLGITLSNGTPLLTGKTVTGFSNIEERLSGKTREVPFSLEDELRKASGRYTKPLLPFTSHVEISERLITGQNPQSARAVADAVITLL